MDSFRVFLCSFLCIAILTEAAPANYQVSVSSYRSKQRSAPKSRHQHAKARVIDKIPFFLVGDDQIVKLPHNETRCYYEDRLYRPTDRWIDTRRCRSCECFPTVIGCTQVSMLPLNISSHCTRLQDGNNTTVARLGPCLVPLVERASQEAGRTLAECRDHRLERKLRGKKWFIDQKNDTLAIAKLDRNSNAKREAFVRINPVSSSARLHRFMEKVRLYQLEVGPELVPIISTS